MSDVWIPTERCTCPFRYCSETTRDNRPPDPCSFGHRPKLRHTPTPAVPPEEDAREALLREHQAVYEWCQCRCRVLNAEQRFSDKQETPEEAQAALQDAERNLSTTYGNTYYALLHANHPALSTPPREVAPEDLPPLDSVMAHLKDIADNPDSWAFTPEEYATLTRALSHPSPERVREIAEKWASHEALSGLRYALKRDVEAAINESWEGSK